METWIPLWHFFIQYHMNIIFTAFSRQNWSSAFFHDTNQFCFFYSSWHSMSLLPHLPFQRHQWCLPLPNLLCCLMQETGLITGWGLHGTHLGHLQYQQLHSNKKDCYWSCILHWITTHCVFASYFVFLFLNWEFQRQQCNVLSIGTIIVLVSLLQTNTKILLWCI